MPPTLTSHRLASGPHGPHGQDGRLLREAWSALVRHRLVALLVFTCVFAAVIGSVSLMPSEYEASMKLLVKRERMDPVMTPSSQASSQAGNEVSEEELNSEVELLQGRDLLEQVVVAVGLVTPPGERDRGPESSRAAIARAVRTLQSDLNVSAIRKTNLIEVQYRSTNPDRAVDVLARLANLYIEKHLAVHRPAGAYEFFQEQTRAFGAELETAEAQLATFGREARVVAPVAERDSTIQALAEFETTRLRTQASIAEADQRIRTLQQQLAAMPNRQTTQIQTTMDGDRIRDLKAQLLALEVKRTDMLVKFNDEYPPLQQLVVQIAQLQAALNDALATPVTAETTDQNPTHQWLRDELARVATDRDALRARELALAEGIAEYRAKARHLDEAGVQQERLVRAVKTAQEAFALYQHKQEEARISDALDRTRIANVSIAERPTAPALPSNSARLTLLMAGFSVALLLGVLSALLLDRVRGAGRVPDGVLAFATVPSLSSGQAGFNK